jgi:hypothetical protein
MSPLSHLLPRRRLTPRSPNREKRSHLKCAPRLAIAAAVAIATTGSTSTGVLAGTLSITVPASTTLPNTAISVGTVTAGVNAATWGETAGSNVGWKGTLAVQQFHILGTNAWTPGASNVLANNNSGQYTGNTPAAAYTLIVTGASAAGATTVAISWSGEEAGSGTATKNAAFAVGALGMTITFKSAQAYATTDIYTAQVGNLATTALALAQATTVITLVSGAGGTNLPTATGGTSTVTSGTTSTYSAAPVKFVTAANTKGVGTFTVTPGVTLTWDPNNTWALAYTASAQYTITSGP